MTRSDARRRLRAELRAAADVLRRDWDPIGGGAMPDLPTDEYDAYAPHIVGLLANGATDVAVATYLRGLEADNIEVDSGCDLIAVAQKLRLAVQQASTVPALHIMLGLDES